MAAGHRRLRPRPRRGAAHDVCGARARPGRAPSALTAPQRAGDPGGIVVSSGGELGDGEEPLDVPGPLLVTAVRVGDLLTELRAAAPLPGPRRAELAAESFQVRAGRLLQGDRALKPVCGSPGVRAVTPGCLGGLRRGLVERAAIRVVLPARSEPPLVLRRSGLVAGLVVGHQPVDRPVVPGLPVLAGTGARPGITGRVRAPLHDLSPSFT